MGKYKVKELSDTINYHPMPDEGVYTEKESTE